jgi:hypothetical protein
MTIEEIYNSGYISIRTFNVCNQNGLNHLNSIIQYYNEFEHFYKFKNCGRKSNEELTALCLKYFDYHSNHYVEHLEQKKHNISRITNFTRTQRDIVNSFIDINKNYLSNRGKNAINAYLDGNFKIHNISEKILANNKFNFQEIRNVGAKTLIELKSFFKSISDFIENVSGIESEKDLVAMRNRFFIEKTFSISSIPDKILESQSVFSLVDFLISNDSIFEKNENTIFLKTFKIYKGQPELTTEAVAKEINITKERTRQIRKIIVEKLFNYFQFTRNIEHDLYQNYNIDLNQNIIKIEDDLNNLINRINETNFSKEFNSFIIFTCISDRFDLVGDIEDVLLPKYFNARGQHNWNNFYLVNKKINCSFNFIGFANNLDERLNERIEENYSFNFNSYLTDFLTSTNLDGLKAISETAEIILNSEFGIYIDTEDNIEFKRNSAKQGYQYAYEALKLLGKPSKVYEISEKIKEMNPDYETDESKVRSSLSRKHIFVPIGRSSTFGLKEWENEIENFKGGTIRGIVYDYLESEADPKHISEIAKYVLNYRPSTYERSILDNLKADETKTFIFFKNSTIGIRSKKYSNSFVELNQIDSLENKSWEERYNNFTEFINRNNRLPSSRGRDNEEIRLNTWYRAQKWKIQNGKLNNEKCKLLSKITSRISKIDTSYKYRSNNLEKYNELKQFFILNSRLPSANKPTEVYLYRFFYKQRKLYENGELDQFEQIKFIELAKLFKN